MRHFLIAIVAIAATFPAVAQQAENYIQVNGSAEIEVIPNQFFLSITLDQNDSKGRVDIDQQRRQMLSELKSLGIDTEKQLTIANISSNYFKRGLSLSVAKYQLLLTTAEQVVAVYDKLAEIGVSNISISRVSHSDIEQYKSDCRKQAIQNAKKVATELAEAVNQSIGSCIYIYDSNRGITPTYYNDGVVLMRAKAANDSAQEPEEPIEFEKITLSYSVNAKFRLNE